MDKKGETKFAEGREWVSQAVPIFAQTIVYASLTRANHDETFLL